MAKEKNIKIDFPIYLVDICLIEFFVLKKLPEKFEKSGLEREKVSFGFNVEMNINPSTEIIHMRINTMFFAEKEKVTSIGNILTSAEFKTKDIGKSIEKFNKKLPNEFLATLISILLSSTRGMLALKSKNTIMEGILLPLINPMTFFNKKDGK